MATGVWAGRLGGVVVERTGLESRVTRKLCLSQGALQGIWQVKVVT
jgi:hypothetical protein